VNPYGFVLRVPDGCDALPDDWRGLLTAHAARLDCILTRLTATSDTIRQRPQRPTRAEPLESRLATLAEGAWQQLEAAAELPRPLAQERTWAQTLDPNTYMPETAARLARLEAALALFQGNLATARRWIAQVTHGKEG
jgi:hypothetical protein